MRCPLAAGGRGRAARGRLLLPEARGGSSRAKRAGPIARACLTRRRASRHKNSRLTQFVAGGSCSQPGCSYLLFGGPEGLASRRERPGRPGGRLRSSMRSRDSPHAQTPCRSQAKTCHRFCSAERRSLSRERRTRSRGPEPPSQQAIRRQPGVAGCVRRRPQQLPRAQQKMPRRFHGRCSLREAVLPSRRG
jgi:hypothetical protein